MSTITLETGRQIRRAEFIALVAAMMAVNSLAIDIMLPALPYMGAALGVADENSRQLVLSSYMLGFGLTQLVFGPLSDRYGRRGPLIVGLGIYTVAALLAAFAPNFEILLLLRLVQGMGAASTRVISQSIVRDVFSGRAMAEIMSLVFMVFMIMPVLAPGIGQILLLTGPWAHIFFFIGLLGLAIAAWTAMRLPETLSAENRRPLQFMTIVEGFRLVFTNRMAFSYAMAGVFVFGALFGFINASQQIYVDIYGLGELFPLAFAAVASVMSLASYLNSRIVGRFGMRRISHGSLLVLVIAAIAWWVTSLFGTMPLFVFMGFLATVMVSFGWTASNMNSLSLEPLGKVAGTAAAVFGFLQTVGGAILGLLIGRAFDGTVTPIAGGFALMGILALCCVMVAEKGRLFGVGSEY